MSFLGLVRKSFRDYAANFSTALGFGLLLFFVFLFLQFSNFFVSSGSVFVYYALGQSSPVFLLALLLLVLVFLFFYSVFVCLMVFSVRNHLSRVKLHYYLTQKIRKFAFKYFVLSAVFCILAYIVVLFCLFVGLPLFVPFFVLFLASSSILFVPQAIVVDEASIGAAVSNNFEFVSKDFFGLASVIFLGALFSFLVILLEFVLDYFLFVGNIVSILIVFFFIIPFLEVVKTRLYMKKFTLLVERQVD